MVARSKGCICLTLLRGTRSDFFVTTLINAVVHFLDIVYYWLFLSHMINQSRPLVTGLLVRLL